MPYLDGEDGLPLHVEIEVDGQWLDITDDALARDGLTITRGRQSAVSGLVAPTHIATSIRNVDGRYSPRNPRSPYYGQLAAGTPLRVVVGTVPASDGTAVAVQENDHVAPSIVAGGDGLLICAWQTWSASTGTYSPPAGMDDPIATVGSTGIGNVLLTAHEQVSSGATGTRTAHAASAVRWAAASTWIPGDSLTVEEHVGDVVGNDDVTVTTMSAQAGWWLVAVHGVGRDSQDVMLPPSGGGWQLIADTVVANTSYPRIKIWAKPVTQAGAQTVTASWLRRPGVTISGDNHLRVLLLSGVDPWSVRGIGRVADWPIRWTSDADVWSPISAYGPLRELTRPGLDAIASPLRREATSVRNIGLRQYWPCEDGSGSTSIASGLPGGPPMDIRGTVTLAVDESIEGSLPLPRFDDPGQFAVGFPPVDPTGTTVVYRGMWSIPAAGPSVPLARLVDLFAVGTAAPRWRLGIDASGNLLVQAYSQTGTLVANSGAIGFGANGRTGLVGFSLTQVGGDVDWAMMARWIVDGQLAGEGGYSGSFPGITLGQVRGMVIGSGLLDFASGHHMLGNDLALGVTLEDAIVGWRGEPAGRRIARLAAEEGVPLTVQGDPDATELMGAQLPGQLMALMQQCADTDGGMICEARESLELVYRTRADIDAVTPVLKLDYAGPGQVLQLEVDDSDYGLVNDLTVSRAGGSSVRVEQATGRKGVAEPPAGAGRRPAPVELSMASDARLHELAAWLLRVATWDEPRYPVLRLSMEALAGAGEWDLQDALAGLDIRDLVAITNPPEWLPPEDLRLLPEGFVEQLSAVSWSIAALSAVPAGPFVVAELDSADDRVALRVSPVGTVTAADFDAGTDTSLSITGETWSDSATYPVDVLVRGIRLTVTAVSGSTLTVDQAPVNGITGITIPAGTPVELAERPGIGL